MIFEIEERGWIKVKTKGYEKGNRELSDAVEKRFTPQKNDTKSRQNVSERIR